MSRARGGQKFRQPGRECGRSRYSNRLESCRHRASVSSAPSWPAVHSSSSLPGFHLLFTPCVAAPPFSLLRALVFGVGVLDFWNLFFVSSVLLFHSCGFSGRFSPFFPLRFFRGVLPRVSLAFLNCHSSTTLSLTPVSWQTFLSPGLRPPPLVPSPSWKAFWTPALLPSRRKSSAPLSSCAAPRLALSAPLGSPPLPPAPLFSLSPRPLRTTGASSSKHSPRTPRPDWAPRPPTTVPPPCGLWFPPPAAPGAGVGDGGGDIPRPRLLVL